MTNSKLSPAQAARELLARRRARAGLLDFTTYTKPDYSVNFHHRVLCDYLDRFVAGEIKRLIVSMPPRHGKSELVSRRLPAYIFGRNPNARIIAASYGADLASRMNRDVQRVMDSDEYARLFPDSALNADNVRNGAHGNYLRNSDLFEIVGHTGSYRSAGVGGGITGMGFDYGIIDDPLKDYQQAHSPTIRDSVWDWYTSTFYTRQEGRAGILITMTRWHTDDLVGRLLQAQGGDYADDWTVLDFPAIAEAERHDDDPREEGEPLWADKYPLDTLYNMRANLGTYQFNALYQQKPMASQGGLFDTTQVQIVDTLPDGLLMTRYWDLAVTAKKHSDYTVGCLLGIDGNGDVYVADIWRAQREFPDVRESIVQTGLIDSASVPIRLEAEKAGLIGLQELLRDPRMHAHAIDAVPPVGDKYSRALPVASRVNAGKLKLLRAGWNRALIDELSVFPMGAHDDQVDALSGAYTYADTLTQPIVLFSL